MNKLTKKAISLVLACFLMLSSFSCLSVFAGAKNAEATASTEKRVIKQGKNDSKSNPAAYAFIGCSAKPAELVKNSAFRFNGEGASVEVAKNTGEKVCIVLYDKLGYALTPERDYIILGTKKVEYFGNIDIPYALVDAEDLHYFEIAYPDSMATIYSVSLKNNEISNSGNYSLKQYGSAVTSGNVTPVELTLDASTLIETSSYEGRLTFTPSVSGAYSFELKSSRWCGITAYYDVYYDAPRFADYGSFNENDEYVRRLVFSLTAGTKYSFDIDSGNYSQEISVLVKKAKDVADISVTEVENSPYAFVENKNGEWDDIYDESIDDYVTKFCYNTDKMDYLYVTTVTYTDGTTENSTPSSNVVGDYTVSFNGSNAFHVGTDNIYNVKVGNVEKQFNVTVEKLDDYISGLTALTIGDETTVDSSILRNYETECYETTVYFVFATRGDYIIKAKSDSRISVQSVRNLSETVVNYDMNYDEYSYEEDEKYCSEIEISVDRITKIGITYTCETSSPIVFNSVKEASRYIGNDYIEAYIRSNGHYTMGTTLGDPAIDTDDYKLLLYGHPDSETTETLISIDGGDYFFDDYVSSVEYFEDYCVATAEIYGIVVYQTLTLETNAYSGVKDTMSISYKYINTTVDPHEIGVRIMLDTMLGSNDGAPFRVNGKEVTSEVEYSGSAVPEYWQAFDSLAFPNVTSTGFFYTTPDERPDKVQFAAWPRIRGASWNYQIDENCKVTGDSAVAAYFNPRLIPAGGSKTVVTYYGTSNFVAQNSDLTAPLSVRVTSPSMMLVSESGEYFNNPYSVTAYINNSGESELKNVTAKLVTSDSKLSVETEKTITLGTLSTGEDSIAKWTVRALPQMTATTTSYKVELSADGVTKKTINLSLALPKLNEEDAYKNVTFSLNGAPGTVPAAQKILTGTFAAIPAAPTRDGYVFLGWYANSNCTGTPWFNRLNSFNGEKVTENIVLYAKWVVDSKVQFGVDTFNFENSYSDFSYSNYFDYTITGEYYDTLLKGLSDDYKSEIISEMKDEWGGSCFGMSAALSLFKANSLDVDFFQSSALSTYELSMPKDSATVWNLMNYYQLSQMLPEVVAKKSYNKRSETANNKAIYNKIIESDYPVVVCFNIYEGNDLYGGHAVVAYDIVSDGNFYKISIADPNDKAEPNMLYISKDFKTSYFTKLYDSRPYKTYLKYAFTVEEKSYDSKNIQQAIQATYDNRDYNYLASAVYTDKTRLMTNYYDFNISCSNGKSAAIIGGIKSSGDLDISDADCINEINEELCLSYELPTLADGEKYTITVTDNNNEEFTTSFISNTEDGFWSSISAEDNGDIVIDDDGGIETKFDGNVNQTIEATYNGAGAEMYNTKISGSDTSLKVLLNSEKHVEVASENDTPVNISVSDDYSNVNFDSVNCSTSGIAVVEKANEIALVDDEASEIASETRRVSAVFYTGGGTGVETISNIYPGSYIDKPSSPTRVGYKFAGWYKDSALTTAWDFNYDTVDADTVLYAKWEEAPIVRHKVIFRAVGQADIIVLVNDGEGIHSDSIPVAPLIDGIQSQWDVTDLSHIYGDIIVNAVRAVIPVTNLTFPQIQTVLHPGNITTLPIEIAPANATETNITWDSDNNSVVTVSNGTITAVGVGTATITATAQSGVSDTHTVTVNSHSYSNEVTAPTCTAEGFTTCTCACGDTYKINPTDALGHSWNSGVVTKAPTTAAEGSVKFTCTRKGCTASKTETVPKLVSAVSGLKAKASTSNSVTLSWNRVANASGYAVYKYNASTKKYEYFKKTSKNYFTVTGLSVNSTVYFKVAAYRTASGKNFYGARSTFLKTYTGPTQVKNLKASSITSNTLKLTWSKVKSASGYAVYKYNASTKKYVFYAKTKATSLTIKGLPVKSAVYFKVAAYRTVNKANYYGTQSKFLKTYTGPAQVKNLKAAAGVKKATLSWSKVSGATGYAIYKYDSASKTYKFVAKTTSLKYTVKNLKSNSTYSFKVRAYYSLNKLNYYGNNSAVCKVKVK